MTNSSIIKTFVLIHFIFVFLPQVKSQDNNEYSILKKYRKWGIVAGPVLFNRAKLEPQYGDYTFENKPMWGFNAGIDYDFYPTEKWSFITGFIVSLEPIYNIKLSFKKEDLYSNFEEGWVGTDRTYATISFSVPLLTRLNFQIGNNTFLNFRTGLKVMYSPTGRASVSWSFSNEDNTEVREMFGLRVESPNNSFKGSFIIGSGISYATKRLLIKSNIIYVVNFQNAMEGEYLFDNMLVSQQSRGYYVLSGNYLGLMFSLNIEKKRNKKQRTRNSGS